MCTELNNMAFRSSLVGTGCSDEVLAGLQNCGVLKFGNIEVTAGAMVGTVQYSVVVFQEGS
jgi:hypothetical protein